MTIFGCPSSSSKSSGVCGRLEEVLEVLEESHGPGVEIGVDGAGGEVMGGGVIERERCAVVIWMDGRAFQKEEVPA